MGKWWDDLPARYSKPHKQQSDEQCIKHAISLHREGFDRKACAALITGEVCEESEDTARLLDLRPTASQSATSRGALRSFQAPSAKS